MSDSIISLICEMIKKLDDTLKQELLEQITRKTLATVVYSDETHDIRIDCKTEYFWLIMNVNRNCIASRNGPVYFYAHIYSKGVILSWSSMQSFGSHWIKWIDFCNSTQSDFLRKYGDQI